MATETSNLKLIKPDLSEYYDVAVSNANFDVIDALVGEGYTNETLVNRASKEEFNAHKVEESINSVNGAHGFRSYKGKLAEKVGASWVDITAVTPSIFSWTPEFTNDPEMYVHRSGVYYKLGRLVVVQGSITFYYNGGILDISLPVFADSSYYPVGVVMNEVVDGFVDGLLPEPCVIVCQGFSGYFKKMRGEDLLPSDLVVGNKYSFIFNVTYLSEN